MTAVQVSIAGERKCPRCASALCLTANIGGGQPLRTVGLCPSCDADNSDARQLLDYFAAHPSVAPQDREQVSELLGRWLGSLDAAHPGTVAPAKETLAAAAEAWWAARRMDTEPPQPVRAE